MEGQNPDADLLTMAEAAEALRVSQVTVARWLKQGRLPSYRLGPRAVRIRRADLAAVLSPAAREVPEAMSAPAEAKRPPAPSPVSAPDWLRAGAAEPIPDLGQRLETMRQARALRERILARRRGVALSASAEEVERAREKRGKRL